MSKKILLNIFMLFILIFSTAYAANIDILHYDGSEHKYTGPDVTLNLNGDDFKVSEGLMPPIILENRTLVPVREVFEVLGGKVDWDANERRVDVVLGDKQISLWIDNKNAKVDGEIVKTDVPAKIINSKTMVPARFISEQGGLNVDWDSETKTVFITMPISKITKVEYLKVNNTNCLVVTSSNPISGYKYYMLNDSEPYRLILDIENSEFKFDTQTKNIDDDLISTIRFGNQGNNKNRIVLDLKKETDYVVVPSQDRTKLYYAMAEEFTVPGEEEVKVSGDNKEQENTNKPENNTSNKPEDNINQDENNINNSSGENINQEQNNTINNSGDDINKEQNNSGDNPVDNGNKLENNTSGNNTSDNVQNIVVPDVYITAIKYSTASKKIRILYDGDIEYSHMLLSNPDRIVIDIEKAELKTEGPKEFNLKNNIIKSVRFSQNKEDKVRIVLDLKEKADYKIKEKSNEIQVSVVQPTYKNVVYKRNSANAQITLFGADEEDIKVTHNEDKNKYTLKFSNSDFDCGEGEINPDDNFVERIVITESRIIVTDVGNMSYNIRQSGNNVVITIREKEEIIENTNKKIILIDPGHGGSDPGACNGSAQEKVFNLNIALMLNELLLERDDVEVYMTRSSDKYLNREDRIEISEEINPDLIVSVHNNSLENKSYTGTMVLYYNNDTESQYGDISSKECAQIVLGKLVDALDTVNRGVVNREDLHILSKTPCPSILCEISFISNDAELERLKTKSFQEDAAEAIYEGVVEILGIM